MAFFSCEICGDSYPDEDVRKLSTTLGPKYVCPDCYAERREKTAEEQADERAEARRQEGTL